MPVIFHKNVMYAGGSGGGGASAISDLTDVELTDIADGQILKYDATNQVWVNEDEGGGGSGDSYTKTTLYDSGSDTDYAAYNIPTALSQSIENFDQLLLLTSTSGDGGLVSQHIEVFCDVDTIKLHPVAWSGYLRRYFVADFTNLTYFTYTGAAEGESNRQPRIYKVYGIKFKGGSGSGTDVGNISALAYQQLTPTQYENLTTAEKNNGTIYFVSENSTGASGLKVIEIAQADYDNLTTEEKNNGIPYFVY